ncbi:MAG: UDP-N-acetylmuramoyl-L-alanyl-D-glutamate--2,6-diaminopimelate ligase [Alphaproteobacteria bacterium]|nr:UDP-N-acetylmuramoyl-L-alanyl-D-glutamate--2,6-diaminopimelate ligase [Alphaproteobacteria bacterium]
MRLVDLIGPDPALARFAEMPVIGLAADSRRVGPGFLFAALPGTKLDGRTFVGQALAAGAVAVLAPEGTRLPEGAERIALITDPAPRRRLARIAARFYGQQPGTVAAVTGTNGKSSVADFTRQLWTRLGAKAASIGTLGVIVPGRPTRPSLTTPDPIELHEILSELVGVGVTHLAVEASSHGLDQGRLDGLKVKAGAFTNLTRDHLDYHGSMEAYLASKRILFERVLVDGGTAVLNADAAEAAEFEVVAKKRGLRTLKVGAAACADIRLLLRLPDASGQKLRLVSDGTTVELRLPLLGAFQASNALVALGLVVACGAPFAKAAEALAHVEGVPGRLQLVARRRNGAKIFVDYAHAPDGLDTVLAALRPHVPGRLAVVFGAGGDRDAGKRPLMGEAAQRHADIVIVTDDNPRSEDPAKIRRQVLAGCPAAREIGDRATAIREAILRLEPDDILVVAGKGHEQGQIVGTRTIPFDDATVSREAVAEIERTAGALA